MDRIHCLYALRASYNPEPSNGWPLIWYATKANYMWRRKPENSKGSNNRVKMLQHH